MDKLAAFTLVVATAVLTACNPFVAPAAADGLELCLQEGYTPCHDTPPTSLRD